MTNVETIYEDMKRHIASLNARITQLDAEIKKLKDSIIAKDDEIKRIRVLYELELKLHDKTNQRLKSLATDVRTLPLIQIEGHLNESDSILGH